MRPKLAQKLPGYKFAQLRFARRKVKRELKKIEKNKDERSKARKKALALLACPNSIDPIKKGPNAGWYVKINGTVWAQAMIFGQANNTNAFEKGYEDGLDPYFVDELLTYKPEAGATFFSHVTLVLGGDEIYDTFDTTYRKATSAIIQQQNEGQVTIGGELNKHKKSEVVKEAEAVRKGKYKYYDNMLAVCAKGKSKAEVDRIITSLKLRAKAYGVECIIPHYGQRSLIKTMLPDTFINDDYLQPTATNVIAATFIARRLFPIMANKGIILGRDPRTLQTVYANFDDDSMVNKNSFLLGCSGSGKTTYELMFAARARARKHRVIMLQPKYDSKTDYQHFCNTYGGRLIQFGKGGSNFNPLMIFFDPIAMGTDPEAFDMAYSDHLDLMEYFFDRWIGRNFSGAMRSYLIYSLIELYKEAHIIDEDGNPINTDKWLDPSIWPSIGDLRDLWKRLAKDPAISEGWPSFNALYGNTMKAAKGGNANWVDNKNAPNLDNDLIVIDMCRMSPGLKEAFSVLITGIIMTRFARRKNDVDMVHTHVILDEGANLMKYKTLREFIETLFRQCRSSKMSVMFGTQDTAGMTKATLEYIKTNIEMVFLLGNMTDFNDKSLIDGFALNSEDIARLHEPGWGKMRYIIGDSKVDVDVVLTYPEALAILKKTPEQIKAELDLDQIDTIGLQLDPRVEWLRDEHGIFSEKWALKPFGETDVPDFESQLLTVPLRDGKNNIWLRTDLEDDEGHYKNQTLDHYSTVCLLAGELCLADGSEVIIDHYGQDIQADISVVFKIKLPDGTIKRKRIAIEYEHFRSHSIAGIDTKIKDLKTMKNQAGEYVFDEVIVVCDSKMYPKLKAAFGADCVKSRGRRLNAYIENHKSMQMEVLADACQPIPA